MTGKASQAALVPNLSEGRWFKPTPYLRSRIGVLDLGVTAVVGFQGKGLPLPVA
ncbi:MAG: hypothetical protein Kow00122_21200 [Thermoleophilia bacterium]